MVYDEERKRMSRPLTVERVPPRISLDDRLKIGVTWSKTNDPTALWSAHVGDEAWIVRVNDFPEEHLYTLYVNDEELGSFDEWPRQWSRAEGSVEPVAP
jgi:hypothetical protein